jgi:hypothetical protein
VTDRIASDAPAVDSHSAHLVRSGGTSQPAVAVPDATALSGGEEIALVLDGQCRHARVGAGADGPVIRAAYDTPGDHAVVAGEDSSVGASTVTNRLVEWCRRVDRERGDAVELDEIDPGYHYGLRVPGERAVYELRDRPNESLRDIARGLDS